MTVFAGACTASDGGIEEFLTIKLLDGGVFMLLEFVRFDVADNEDGI